MWRTSVKVFEHFDGNFVLFLCQFLEKLERKYAIINIGINIDIKESIDTDKYRHRYYEFEQLIYFKR